MVVNPQVNSRGLANRYDVIVCGDGLFAVWASILLSRSGVKVLRLHHENPGFSGIFPGLGVAWGSLPDLPTRAEVAHGRAIANELRQFAKEGANEFFRIAQSELRLSFQPMKTYRFSSLPPEIRELEIASQHFHDLYEVESSGKDPSLRVWEDVQSYDLGMSSVLNAAEAEAFSAQLRELESEDSRIHSMVLKIEECGDKVKIFTAELGILESEFVVCGLGAASGRALSRLSDVLVPLHDFMTQIDVRGIRCGAPFAFRALNGLISGCVRQSQDGVLVSISGPRFALTGQDKAVLDESSTETLQKDVSMAVWSRVIKPLSDGLSFLTNRERPDLCEFFHSRWCEALGSGVHFKIINDCLPCDELPLLGEFGVQGRILGSAGWQGCGHGMSFFAARLVVESILFGRPVSREVPAIFSSRRFLI